jgi:hypothetical protein
MISDTGYSCSAANYRSLVAAMRTTDAGPRRYALTGNQWAGCGAAVVLGMTFHTSGGQLLKFAGDRGSTSFGDSLRRPSLTTAALERAGGAKSVFRGRPEPRRQPGYWRDDCSR